MPTYRRATQLGQSVRSLMEGQFSDFELLVCDDGDGTDGTEQALLEACESDKRVVYHRNPRRLGMPGNLNEGIRKARGELVAVCHDHDLYAPDFIQAMVGALERHHSALFAHCGIEIIDQHGNHISKSVGNWPELSPGLQWLRFMLRRFDCPVCALTLVRRSAHQRYGLYDSNYGFISDVEMWMRLSANGDVAYINRPLVRVRTREQDHPANWQALRFTLDLARMQRRYVGRAYGKSFAAMRRIEIDLRLVRRFGLIAASAAKRRAMSLGQLKARSQIS